MLAYIPRIHLMLMFALRGLTVFWACILCDTLAFLFPFFLLGRESIDNTWGVFFIDRWIS